MKVLSIDGTSRILDGIKDEVHIYEDCASRILDGIKDEVHIYEDSASRILDGIKDEIHIYMKMVHQGYWSIHMKIYLL